MTTHTSKVAIVTGASRGIGAVIAKQLASEGFSVAINYASSASEASKLVVELRQAGHQAIAIKADVANVDDAFAWTPGRDGRSDPVSISRLTEKHLFAIRRNLKSGDVNKYFVGLSRLQLHFHNGG